MGQIGEPLRRYTVIPLEEPVAPTPEQAGSNKTHHSDELNDDFEELVERALALLGPARLRRSPDATNESDC